MGVAKEKMSKAELICKPVTSVERKCSTSFDILEARDYPASRIAQGLKGKEFGKNELMALCSTRGLKYNGDKEEILIIRLREYADDDLQKGKFYSYTS